jgi:hypothetical protein
VCPTAPLSQALPGTADHEAEERELDDVRRGRGQRALRRASSSRYEPARPVSAQILSAPRQVWPLERAVALPTMRSAPALLSRSL